MFRCAAGFLGSSESSGQISSDCAGRWYARMRLDLAKQLPHVVATLVALPVTIACVPLHHPCSPAGFYCPTEVTLVPTICPAGYFCEEGLATPTPCVRVDRNSNMPLSFPRSHDLLHRSFASNLLPADRPILSNWYRPSTSLCVASLCIRWLAHLATPLGSRLDLIVRPPDQGSSRPLGPRCQSVVTLAFMYVAQSRPLPLGCLAPPCCVCCPAHTHTNSHEIEMRHRSAQGE